MPSFVALIDRRFGEMVSYYRSFSSDESWSGQIEIQPRDVLPFAYGSVEALFTQIRDQLQRGRKHIVVGTHGYPDQLPYPVIAGTDVAADSSMLDALGRAAAGSAADRQFLLNQQSMRNVPVFKDGARLDRLLALIRAIQANRLEHLEIRGCNLGSGTGLKALHGCLNSRHTVAPTVTYMSGLVAPSRQAINDAQLQGAVSRMGPKTRNYTRSDCGQPPNASGDDSLGLALRWTEVSVSPHRFTTGISALSPQAVLGWTHTALENSHYHIFGRTAPGGGWRAGTPVPMIGMWTPNGSKPWVLPGDGFDYLSFLAVENTP
jgi:hypothetical protein